MYTVLCNNNETLHSIRSDDRYDAFWDLVSGVNKKWMLMTRICHEEEVPCQLDEGTCVHVVLQLIFQQTVKPTTASCTSRLLTLPSMLSKIVLTNVMSGFTVI